VDTFPVVAGFEFESTEFSEEKSVITPSSVAGFGGHADRAPPRPRTATPAARR
jgi:hypothetical protein